MKNPVGWFEIYVNTMARARRFYETVLDVTLAPLDSGDINSDQADLSMMLFPSDDNATGCSGALVRAPGVEPGHNSVMVYFSCDDCAVEGARVTQAGGELVRQKMAIGEYGFIVLAKDSEGNMFGLHSKK
ncbi:VOC family protein [Alteromonas sp. CYL-A6]|uniref:VOC family protein n=1 Tax=Alteromonas nitratireducens TaxID=3390813 RepID=UPI0034ADAB41